MAVNVRQERAQFFDQNGNPLSGGSVQFFSAGTDQPKEVYHDAARTTTAGSDVNLDSGGFVGNDDLSGGSGGLWYGTGNYRIKVYNSAGSLQWTMDDIQGEGAAVAGTTEPAFVISMENLRGLSVSSFSLAYVQGYTLANDNGGGWFYFDAANTDAENQGTRIVPFGGGGVGRWIRIINDNHIRPEMFGIEIGNNTQNTVTRFGLMIDYCKGDSRYKHISIPAGVYWMNGTIIFDGDITIEIMEGVQFQGISGSSNVNILCSDAIIHSFETSLVIPFNGPSPTTQLLFNPDNKDREAFVEWWNIKGDVVASDTEEIALALVGCPEANLIFSGGVNYSTDETTDFSNNKIIIRNNSLLDVFTATFTFGDILIDQDRPGLSGDFTDITFNSRREFDINWFVISTGTNVDEVVYASLMENLTGAAAQITVNWKRGTYSFGSVTIDSQAARKLNHNISGATLIFSSSFLFGNILTCSEGISPVGAGVPLLGNREIDVRWFGAISGSTDSSQLSTNVLSILYAMEVQVQSNIIFPDTKPYVVGGGQFFMIDEGIDYTVPVVPALLNISVNFKDIFITNTTGFTPVTAATRDFMISIDGKLELNDSQFLNNLNANNELLYCNDRIRIFNSRLQNDRLTKTCLFHDSSQDCVMIDNRITGDDGIETLSDNLTFHGNELDVNNTNLNSSSCQKASIIGNKFNPSSPSASEVIFSSSVSGVLVGNVFNQVLTIISKVDKFVVSDNTWNNGFLLVVDPTGISITGNTFSGTNSNSYLTLNTEAAGFTVEGLLVTGNNFISSSGTALPIIRFGGGGTFSTLGHQALIKSNNIVGMTLRATEAWVSVTVTAITDLDPLGGNDWYSGVVTVPIPSSIILPNASQSKLIAAIMDEVKTVGVEVAADAYAGILEVYERASSYPNLDVRIRWSGDITVPLALTQVMNLKIKVSEDL